MSQARMKEAVATRLSVALEVVRFFWTRRWWWLTPMVILLLLVGLLIIVGQTSALAPFIYSLF